MNKDELIIFSVFAVLILTFVSINFTGNIMMWDFGSMEKEKGGIISDYKSKLCIDTDKGYNFGVQGVCFEGKKEKGRDACKGTVLTEWFCSNTGTPTGRLVEDITGNPIVGWDLNLISSGNYCYKKTFDCSKLGQGFKCLGGVCVKLGR